MKLLLLIGSLYLLLQHTSSLNAQKGDMSEDGCRRIDINKPSVYIKYQGLEEDKKKRVILLKVQNNTTCDLIFYTRGNYYRWVDGKWIDYVEDGEEVSLWYLISFELDNKAKKRLNLEDKYVHYREPNEPFHMMHSLRLKKGRSFVFKVEFDHFKKGRIITVPFLFSWGEEPSSYNDRWYEISYNWGDLPQYLKKKKD